MEAHKLLSNTNVRHRLKTFFLMTRFSSSFVGNASAGALFTVIFIDVITFFQIRKGVEYGELPWYTSDVLLVNIAFVEVIACPVWALLCPNRRCTIMMVCALIPAITVCTLLVLPDVKVESGTEFCSPYTLTPNVQFNGISANAASRLSVIIILGFINSICRGGLWIHSVAILEENKPKTMSLNYGILIGARFVGLVIVPKFLGGDMSILIQVLGVSIPQCINVLQMRRIPARLPADDEDLNGNKLPPSIRRVLSSGVAVAQMLSMSLVAAALWGYGWNQSSIYKVLYLLKEDSDMLSNQYHIIMFYVPFIVAIFCGMVFKKTELFNKVSAMKLATFMSVFLVVVYCSLTMLLTCDSGLVAGLSKDKYTQPACSQQCRCTVPYSGFSPICVADSLTTHLSPCHAGCGGSDTISGLTVFRECGCAPTNGMQRATPGACNSGVCNPSYLLHKILFFVALTLTLIILQAQGVTILRSFERNDKILAYGIAMSLTIFITHIVGHLGFFAIDVSSCAWFESGMCQLHNANFPTMVGGVCAGLIGLALIINIVTWIVLKRRVVTPVETLPLS